MSKVVVAGVITLDITPRITKTGYAIGDLFSPGRLTEIDGSEIHLGGAVSNTGLALKKLGVDTALCAKIGNDSYGKILRDILSEYGVEGIRTDERFNTSHSYIIAIPGIDRMILHDPGANHHFYADDIPEDILKDTVLFHFGYPPLMRSIYQNQGEEMIRIFRKMKEKRIVTSLDMALFKPETEAGHVDWKQFLSNVLPLTDIFTPSIEELLLMLDREYYLEQTGGGTMPLDVKKMKERCPDLADMALRMGCKVVMIKCGAEGLFYRSSSTGLDALADKLPIRVEDWAGISGFRPAFSVEKVVSAIGAGDTCIAGFLAAALEGRPLAECAALAAAEGACCVTSHDTLSSLQPLDVLKSRIDDGWM